MMDIMVKIMVEVLSILAFATKEVKQSRTSELTRERLPFLAYRCLETFLKKLVGRTDIEDALRKLDKLTQDEVRMVAAQSLKEIQGVSDSVQVVEDRVTTVIEGGFKLSAQLLFLTHPGHSYSAVRW